LHNHYGIDRDTDRIRYDRLNSHNFITSQLDLELRSGDTLSPQVVAGWAIEPDDQPYAPYPYRIQNLEYGYRLAPPFSESEAIRVIGILGHAAGQPDGMAANIAIESAWISIVWVA
jgi:hypothetical protein